MKHLIKHIIISLVFLFCFEAFSQTKEKGYRIEGDDIVFVFDKRDYTKARSELGLTYDFDDLDIQNVVVSGEFNNWSKKQWYLKRIDENRFELRKKLSDFNDEFLWEFKFVINNTYWAEPSKAFSNSIPIKNSLGFKYYAYNLSFSTITPVKKGNAQFRLKGFKNAKYVVVAGSFNKWNTHQLQMRKTKEGWAVDLQLKPNLYQYKYIVDGKWMEDPHNTNKVKNEFGEHNSVIDIQQAHTFVLDGHTNAKHVFLSGSFNNWQEQELLMKRQKDGWVYTLKLPAGKHHYKFIVDGKWMTDPSNTVKEFDFDGNINSVCMIK